MKRALVFPVATVFLAIGLVIAGCAQAPAPAPTSAPPPKPAEAAKAPAPAPTQAPAAPTKAPAPAPTLAPAPTKAAEAPAKKVVFPEKGRPITLIVPLGAGSGTDIASRVMAAGIEKELGTPVQVVNKTGSSTIVGMTDLVRARPDGYTLGTTVFMTIIASYLDPELKATYARKDFQAVSHYMLERNVLIVKGDSPYKTMKDLVDAGKAEPMKVKFGASGILGNPHVAVLMLQQVSGAKFTIVQYPSVAEAVTAVLGGHIDAVVTGGSTVMSHIPSGAVRGLAITDVERNEYYPNIPTLREQGHDVVAPFSTGIAVPAGTPKEVVEVLNGAIGKAFRTDEFQNRVRQAGLSPAYMPSDQFEKYWAELEPRVKPTIALAREK